MPNHYRLLIETSDGNLFIGLRRQMNADDSL